jgi:transposase
MARAYSDDLRRKILQAYEQSQTTYQKVADRFGVSCTYVYNLRQQQLKHGKMERMPQSRSGPRSRLTPEIRRQMAGWIQRRADLTLVELQQELKQQCGVSVSVAQIWLVLQAMGLRLKKSHSMRKSKSRRKLGGVGRVGGKR